MSVALPTIATEERRLSRGKTLLLIALGLALAGVAHAEDWSGWQRAYGPATRTRFIPVELWTGAPWDGTQEIRMAPATLEFGRWRDKSRSITTISRGSTRSGRTRGDWWPTISPTS